MKTLKKLTTLLLFLTITLFSCKGKSQTPNTNAEKVTPPTPTTTNAPINNTTTNTPINNTTINTPPRIEPAQNAAGIWHYTCIKGCAGGAGTATNCTTCGIQLAHNTGYHTNTVQSSAPFATQPVAPQTMTTTTTNRPEPSQNAAGVWHYTCGKGCAGGAGVAVNCGSCGTALVHNVAYHQ